MDIECKDGGILRAIVRVKRKATGEVETYELTGAATPEQVAALIADSRGTIHHGAAGAVIGPGPKLTND